MSANNSNPLMKQFEDQARQIAELKQALELLQAQALVQQNGTVGLNPGILPLGGFPHGIPPQYLQNPMFLNSPYFVPPGMLPGGPPSQLSKPIPVSSVEPLNAHSLSLLSQHPALLQANALLTQQRAVPPLSASFDRPTQTAIPPSTLPNSFSFSSSNNNNGTNAKLSHSKDQNSPPVNPLLYLLQASNSVSGSPLENEENADADDSGPHSDEIKHKKKKKTETLASNRTRHLNKKAKTRIDSETSSDVNESSQEEDGGKKNSSSSGSWHDSTEDHHMGQNGSSSNSSLSQSNKPRSCSDNSFTFPRIQSLGEANHISGSLSSSSETRNLKDSAPNESPNRVRATVESPVYISEASKSLLLFDANLLFVEDLKEELRLRHLSTTGTKPILLERLYAAMKSNPSLPRYRLTESGNVDKSQESRRKKEPRRDEFQTEEGFRAAWERWRDVRDSNNESVKKSRQLARRKKEDQAKRCQELEDANSSLSSQLRVLQKDIFLLSKVLKSKSSLTADEKTAVKVMFEKQGSSPPDSERDD